MTTDPWQDVRIVIGWPDEQAGPFLVEVHFQRSAGWRCVGVGLEFADPAGVRALETSDLRNVRLPPIVERAYAGLVVHLETELERAKAASPGPGDHKLDYRKRLLAVKQLEEALAAARPRKVGRPPLPRYELERVATIYAAALAKGEPPVKAVAAALGCGPSTAAKRVALCRRRGVLLATEPGVAGGVPVPMRRVRARDLAVLIENEERGAERDGEGDR
jgi:hypothetical protein